MQLRTVIAKREVSGSWAVRISVRLPGTRVPQSCTIQTSGFLNVSFLCYSTLMFQLSLNQMKKDYEERWARKNFEEALHGILHVIVSRNYPVEDEEIHVKTQSGWRITLPRYDSSTSCIQIYKATATSKRSPAPKSSVTQILRIVSVLTTLCQLHILTLVQNLIRWNYDYERWASK